MLAKKSNRTQTLHCLEHEQKRILAVRVLSQRPWERISAGTGANWDLSITLRKVLPKILSVYGGKRQKVLTILRQYQEKYWQIRGSFHSSAICGHGLEWGMNATVMGGDGPGTNFCPREALIAVARHFRPGGWGS